MNPLRYKTLYCKTSKRFISVKDGTLKFVEIPVLYLKYRRFEIDNLTYDEKFYLYKNATIKHYKLLYENDVVYDRRPPFPSISMEDIKLIKENLHLPIKEIHKNFFEDVRSYDSVKSLVYKIKKGLYN